MLIIFRIILAFGLLLIAHESASLAVGTPPGSPRWNRFIFDLLEIIKHNSSDTEKGACARNDLAVRFDGNLVSAEQVAQWLLEVIDTHPEDTFQGVRARINMVMFLANEFAGDNIMTHTDAANHLLRALPFHAEAQRAGASVRVNLAYLRLAGRFGDEIISLAKIKQMLEEVIAANPFGIADLQQMARDHLLTIAEQEAAEPFSEPTVMAIDVQVVEVAGPMLAPLEGPLDWNTLRIYRQADFAPVLPIVANLGGGASLGL